MVLFWSVIVPAQWTQAMACPLSEAGLQVTLKNGTQRAYGKS